MSTPNLLELHNISKSFGALTALRNLSFHIGEGEVVGLLGDNGAGKSTTVNLISGIHKPTDGYLSVDGKKTTFSAARIPPMPASKRSTSIPRWSIRSRLPAISSWAVN